MKNISLGRFFQFIPVLSIVLFQAFSKADTALVQFPISINQIRDVCIDPAKFSRQNAFLYLKINCSKRTLRLIDHADTTNQRVAVTKINVSLIADRYSSTIESREETFLSLAQIKKIPGNFQTVLDSIEMELNFSCKDLVEVSSLFDYCEIKTKALSEQNPQAVYRKILKF